MRRRVPLAEPVAGSAAWSRRCGALAALMAVGAIALGRQGLAGGLAGVAALAAALLLALLAILLALRAAVVIWQQGWRGTGQALAGCLLAGMVLAYPAYLAWTATRLPAIADVSTDLEAPPAFSTSKAARAARGNAVHDEPSAAVRDAQRKGYPDVQPAILDVEPDEAYALTMRLIAQRRWRIVEALAPKGATGVGHIDAVARTPVMAFPEDIAVRIRPQAGQTRVDLRSASRFPGPDLGSNAGRIQALVEELQDAE